MFSLLISSQKHLDIFILKYRINIFNNNFSENIDIPYNKQTTIVR